MVLAGTMQPLITVISSRAVVVEVAILVGAVKRLDVGDGYAK